MGTKFRDRLINYVDAKLVAPLPCELYTTQADTGEAVTVERRFVRV